MAGVNLLIAEVADPQGMKHIQLTLSDETGSLNVVYVITLASAKKVSEGLAATINRAESDIIIPGNGSLPGMN